MACFLTDKIFSARFLATVMIVGTYCLVVLGCLAGSAFGKIDPGLFDKVLMAFAGLAGSVVTAYFHRTDRNGVTTEDAGK